MHNPSHSFFKEDLHSSVSILDKLEKEKAKGKSEVKINEHFFFMDNYHIYKIDKVTKSIHVFQDQNISGLFFSDNNYLYTLSHKRPEKNISSGFRLYDVWNCITTGEDLSYQLSRVQVGCQNLIDFSKNNQRFVFQSSFDKIEVMPVLHRNSIFFMGMAERKEYLATKIIDDKFIALDRSNHLTTWNVLTGKVMQEYDLAEDQDPLLDFSDFQIFTHNTEENQVFNREWYSKILLMKKSPEVSKQKLVSNEQIETKTFFSYDEWIEKDDREFRLIEILNETEVKVVASFNHPFYRGKKQFMYFSESGEYMHEILDYNRFHIYHKESTRDIMNPNRVTWEQKKRITNLPEEYFKSCQHAFYLSPDFMQYLDIDQRLGLFIIRDSINPTQIKFKIPQWLMNVSDLTETVRRFKWHTNNSIKVINNEGFERIVHLDEAFSEEAFHAIPMYMP